MDSYVHSLSLASSHRTSWTPVDFHVSSLGIFTTASKSLGLSESQGHHLGSIQKSPQLHKIYVSHCICSQSESSNQSMLITRAPTPETEVRIMKVLWLPDKKLYLWKNLRSATVTKST